MPLQFHRHPATDSLPVRHVATTGAWPHQRRFIATKQGWEWNIREERHVPGRGFEFISSWNMSIRTLGEAKARCERLANPGPIDRSSSAYTDG